MRASAERLIMPLMPMDSAQGEVPGSNEWNNHIKDMWFGTRKEA